MPQFVFEITEEEWQRFSLVMNVSYVNAGDGAEDAPLTFDDALKQIFLLGLHQLEHEVLGGSDYGTDGEQCDVRPEKFLRVH